MKLQAFKIDNYKIHLKSFLKRARIESIISNIGIISNYQNNTEKNYLKYISSAEYSKANSCLTLKFSTINISHVSSQLIYKRDLVFFSELHF